MPFAVSIRLTGVRQLVQNLRDLDQKMRKKLLRQAMAAAGKVLAKAIKRLTPVRRRASSNIQLMKLLRKSIGWRVRVYRNSGKVVLLVGPRTKFKRQLGVRVRGKNKGRPVFENPTNIAHLVEAGHGGPHPAAGTRFLAGAVASYSGEVERAMADVLTEGLAKGGAP